MKYFFALLIILQAIAIINKLTGDLTVSWWWVLSPLWLLFVILVVAGVIEALKDKRNV